MSGERLTLPADMAGLYLKHNEHRGVYEKLEKWIADQDDFYDWASEEAKQRAIATDECWTLQWYPNTPIGFHSIAAPTLEELLTLAGNPPP